MIVVRNVFQLKFGAAKEAISLWKEGLNLAAKVGYEPPSTRLLTDLVGPHYYTLVFESTYPNLAEFERMATGTMADASWKQWYPKFAALCEGGYREVLNIIE
jgi:hypothetical protein